MLLEGKAHYQIVEPWQMIAFKKLHGAIKDVRYRGFHIVQFENDTPHDGSVFIDGKFSIRKDLVEFLRFEKKGDWYETKFLQKPKV